MHAREVPALTVRNYRPDARAGCLALFDGNTPDFFAPDERAGYARFLDAGACAYLVLVTRDGVPIAAGGYYAADEPALGGLAWGIVAREWHRRGIGTKLLALRLARLRALGVRTARVRTSQRSRPFFARLGFTVVAVVPDGFAPGVDTVEMHRRLES